MFRQQLKQSALIRLITINVVVLVLIWLCTGFLRLFNVEPVQWIDYLQLPADWMLIVHRPWTLLTYMFMHEGFFHLFFNMLCLYWFGKMFLMRYSPRQMVGTYILSGLIGGLIYAVAYNLFPFFSDQITSVRLVGASGAVMGLIVAAAVAMPNYRMHLLLLGSVRLKSIAVITVIISMLGVSGNNAGGEFCHLGGALAGWLYAWLLGKGTDITKPVNCVIDWLKNLLGRRHKQQCKQPHTVYHYAPSDADYNQQRVSNNAELDKILDKIRNSGYASLTEDEKRRLFETSRKL